MTENPDRYSAYAPNIRKRQLEKFRCRYCNKWHDYPVKMETGKYDNPVLPVLEDNQPIELRLCIRTYRYIASAEYVGSPLQQEVKTRGHLALLWSEFRQTETEAGNGWVSVGSPTKHPVCL